MCLIAFAWHAHPRWRLLLLGNRDELHARPTAPLARWVDLPAIRAGRDLKAGGTWIGLGNSGRVAAVTNVRDPGQDVRGASRGLLVSNYLRGARDAGANTRQLLERAHEYRPFNLLVFDANQAYYLGNRPSPGLRLVSPGIHGLSNADFDTPWPKTRTLMQHLETWIATDHGDDFGALWKALADDSEWPDDVLPDTGVGVALERRLSASFIRGEHYGTRASTLIAIEHSGRATIIERRFGANGVPCGETTVHVDAHA